MNSAEAAAPEAAAPMSLEPDAGPGGLALTGVLGAGA